MPDLIPPHGGLSAPIDRNVPAEEQAAYKADLAGLPRLVVSDADLSTLYRIGDGGLSPLTGPMDRATWDRVLDEEVILHDGKKYAWTIPLAFPVSSRPGRDPPGRRAGRADEQRRRTGRRVRGERRLSLGQAKYVQGVYGTTRWDHPGGKMVESDPRTHLVGGEVRVLPQPHASGVRQVHPVAAPDAGGCSRPRAGSAWWRSRRATRCIGLTNTPWWPAWSG